MSNLNNTSGTLYLFQRSRYITGEVHLDVQLNHDEYKAYKNHQVNGSILFPAFGFLVSK